MGNAVIVLNAIDGSVLKVFGAADGINRPVPAPLALVSTNSAGTMDKAYAVDVGGSIYRLTFPDVAPSSWTITKIADFSGSTAAGQKMFYAPAVTVTDQLVAIQVGTGDREKTPSRYGHRKSFLHCAR
jgi:type IV pilus assembly protein PilY1